MSPTLTVAYQHCERIARRSGSNFFCAFLSLPRDMFRQMCVIYAFMRITDDIGDVESASLDDRRSTLDQWNSKLEDAFDSGESQNPVLHALVDVASRKNIPSQLFVEVIDGVKTDLSPREFETFQELQAYCYQVAGVVGLCCLKIWDCHQSQSEHLAIDCGTAFQLTNILRDIGEDAGRGRIYLPREDLDQFGLTFEDIRSRQLNGSFRRLMASQVDRAWSYYEQSAPLVQQITPEGQKILSGFFAVYSSLLHKIEQRDYDVFTKRIRLSRWEKSRIAINSLLGLPSRFTIKTPSQLAGSPSTSD